ncbi:hypothetical protein GJ744_010065 [Endocarpon pusillum]|uniref:Urease accessory protein UreD n=1 Tax=Endocarpon pusillum TaxID=364733 RepID=A0A8H7AGP0_9EURO|nr:hypothetical protein GJ744_010065 [Endocarpon pusillum]
MSLPLSPFATSTSVPGEGLIELSLLPPRKQVLKTLTYQYPLKLISPDPHSASNEEKDPVTVVFLLTYGGGLVGGDKIKLHVDVAQQTRLVLLTQGHGAALCYLPDPTQPFGESVYEQYQTFHVDTRGLSSLCVLDWFIEGRRARGESWTLHSWKGRNEVRDLSFGSNEQGRLLLRDAVRLSNDQQVGHANGLLDKMNGMGVFGTLILQPRIGAKNWTEERSEDERSSESIRRNQRQDQDQADALLWTAAHVRGFILVKFSAREIDRARTWLSSIIRQEGSVEREFGHQALFCLR